MAPALLHYEDLAIGGRYRTAVAEVTAAEIVEFASRFDPQPFHLDEAAGQDSVFGGMAARNALAAATIAPAGATNAKCVQYGR